MNLYELTNNQVGRLTKEEFYSGFGQAVRKLQTILAREGDGGGARLTPEYIALLIAEQIRSDRAYQVSMAVCRERKYI